MKRLGRIVAAIGAAIRSRKRVFFIAAAAVLALDILVPPLVLSVAKKPADFFTVNPWLPQLPGFLASGPGALPERLAKAWDLALFWVSSDNPYGVEWGFAVTTADLARFLLMSALVGAYFALWADRRARPVAGGWASGPAASGGVAGALASVFGLATGGCTVMGCGAPVIPVIGLAFAGLSSTTLKWMSDLSTVATAAVFAGMAAAVVHLAWRASRSPVPAG